MISVRPKAPGDRRPGVELAAKPVIARLGFRLAHCGMPPDQIGTSVLSPAKISDLVLDQRVGVCGRTREWSQDAAVDHGESVPDREVENLVVAFRRVFLEAEDERADYTDAGAMNLADVFLVIADQIELFVSRVQCFLVNGLDAHKEADAARPGGQLEQFVIAADQL